jgi:hypothetical protein
VAGASTAVNGWLHSLPSTTYRLEFFASAAADPSGYGEGASHLGSILVTTNDWGNVMFSTSSLGQTAVGEWIAVTATDVDGGNTSEFSQAVWLSGQPIGPLDPYIDLPETKPPLLDPPCDPLAPVVNPGIGVMSARELAELDVSIFRDVGPAGARKALDVLLALVVSRRKANELRRIDLAKDLAEELQKVLV